MSKKSDHAKQEAEEAQVVKDEAAAEERYVIRTAEQAARAEKERAWYAAEMAEQAARDAEDEERAKETFWTKFKDFMGW
jgi:hypothetical protein